MLYIEIINLNSKINGDIFSKPDFFSKIIYGEQVRVTTTKWNNNNPQWNESFLFQLQENITSQISLELYEKDSIITKESLIEKKTFEIDNTKIKSHQKGIFNIKMGNIYFELVENMKEQYHKLEVENEVLKQKITDIKKIIN